MARRKAIYEVLHPETKANSSEQMKAVRHAEIISACRPSFAVDTAAKVGQTERTIRNKVRIGEQLASVANQLEGTPIEDSQKDLLAIASMEPEEQKAIVSHIAAGTAKNVKQSHGLRSTNEDKRRAVEAALQHAYASRYSNREIAKHCGVSEITIRRYRETICDNVADAPSERLVTRNGATYTMNTHT